VSGTKRERTGLNQLLQAAEDGECGTVYLHSLSRLARESVITMPMLKRLVHKFGIRVICLSEGIDTATNGWEMQATIMAVMNEQYVKDLGANVLRGQEGTKLAGLSVGDYCFGYSSEPVPGTEARGSGRNGKPKMRYVIDPDHAELVRQIFDWFVNERRSITWIAQELNKRGAPKDHRSTTSAWRHGLVATLLRREKYVGVWRWGENRNVRDPESGDVRQERRDEDESSKWTMHHEELRIIDDATFTAAQARLDENAARTASSREDDGTWKAGGGRGSEPRHLLSGVIRCAECDAKFYVGGANGKYLFCPNYKKGLCSCRTTLQRARAERLILQEVGRCIDQDSDWFDSLVRETLSQWTDLQKQVPLERQNAERGKLKELRTARADPSVSASAVRRDPGRKLEGRE